MLGTAALSSRACWRDFQATKQLEQKAYVLLGRMCWGALMLCGNVCGGPQGKDHVAIVLQ